MLEEVKCINPLVIPSEYRRYLPYRGFPLSIETSFRFTPNTFEHKPAELVCNYCDKPYHVKNNGSCVCNPSSWIFEELCRAVNYFSFPLPLEEAVP